MCSQLLLLENGAHWASPVQNQLSPDFSVYQALYFQV